jgi:FkbM family methyltransferase
MSSYIIAGATLDKFASRALLFTYRRLKHIRRLVRRSLSNVVDIAFWYQTLIRYVWKRPFWFTDKYGVTLRVYPESNLMALYKTRLHFDDEPVLQLTKRIVKPGMLIIDVGANRGQYTIFATQMVGEYGQVHSFEPGSDAFHRLRENVDHLVPLVKVVSLNQKAVSNKNGYAVLYKFPPGYSAWNSLSFHKMWSLDKPIIPSSTENVCTITLDDYCEKLKIFQVDLLKIDVEGFEVEVVEGCKRLIKEKRIRNIIFEISIKPLKGTGRTPESVLQAISNMGFDIHRIHSNGDLERVHLLQFHAPHFANYLATPRCE